MLLPDQQVQHQLWLSRGSSISHCLWMFEGCEFVFKVTYFFDVSHCVCYWIVLHWWNSQLPVGVGEYLCPKYGETLSPLSMTILSSLGVSGFQISGLGFRAQPKSNQNSPKPRVLRKDCWTPRFESRQSSSSSIEGNSNFCKNSVYQSIVQMFVWYLLPLPFPSLSGILPRVRDWAQPTALYLTRWSRVGATQHASRQNSPR